MASLATPKRQSTYFPPPHPELTERLRAGDEVLNAAIGNAETSISAGHVLARAGEREGMVYRLTYGVMARVRLIEDGRRQIISVFLPGDLLAVKAMLFDRQPDNIECLSRATVQAIGQREALILAGDHPNVSLRFMWQLAEDERRLHNSVTMLGCGTAVERVSTVLLELKARLSLIGSETTRLSIRQQDLADQVGMTLVHVNRTLRRLREQGAILTENGRIILRDVMALHRHAAPMLDVFESETPKSRVSLH